MPNAIKLGRRKTSTLSRQSSSDTQRFSEAEGALNPYSPKREAFIKKSRVVGMQTASIVGSQVRRAWTELLNDWRERNAV
jgi:hypothetical protein